MTELDELAAIKLKIDLLTASYEKKIGEYKAHAKETGQKEFTNGCLKLTIGSQNRRSFNVEGVKQLGPQGLICIKEEVDAKKFDALFKKGEKYLITESEQTACFTITPAATASWDGLDVYKQMLMDKKNEPKSKSK